MELETKALGTMLIDSKLDFWKKIWGKSNTLEPCHAIISYQGLLNI